MSTIDPRFEPLASFESEPLFSLDQWADVASRAEAHFGAVPAAYVSCALSPPERAIRFVAKVRAATTLDREVAAALSRGQLAGLQLWQEIESAVDPRANGRDFHLCTQACETNAAGIDALREPLELLCARWGVRSAWIERGLRSLPAEARLTSVSMHAAPGPEQWSMRGVLARSAVMAYLSRVCESDLRDHLDALSPWMDVSLASQTVMFELMFRCEVVRTVGIIHTGPTAGFASDHPSHGQLRSRLLTEGLCNLAQDSALAAWGSAHGGSDAGIHRWVDLAVRLNRNRLTSRAYLGFARANS